jgi:threonylcarbamoyladenosine tRNA methylthiotransferase MtaB
MTKPSKKSKVINLGCRLNFFESEIIDNIISKNKKQVVINTCAVTNNAVQKSIYAVKKAIKENPNCEIMVTGCASQIEKERFQKIDKVKRVIDNKFKTLPQSYETEEKIIAENFKFPSLEYHSSERTRATLQIQQGCDHRCTFCIIPFGRGDSISLPIGEISQRMEKILKMGFSEIVLTGVDLTSYGEDLPGKPKLGNILKRLFTLHPNLKRLRLSSIDPAEIDDELFDLFGFEKRLMPHLHLSLQSGDNLILKRMKRRHSRETVIEICERLRSIRKDITFGADLIVGFPTEGKKEFLNSIDLLENCKFSNMHIFPFSPKKGTPAARMPQVEKSIINERAAYARKVFEKILYKQMKEKIGNTKNFLFESENLSHTDDFFKVKIVKKNSDTFLRSGSFVRAKILGIDKDKFEVAI